MGCQYPPREASAARFCPILGIAVITEWPSDLINLLAARSPLASVRDYMEMYTGGG